jgi:hypothetical protein
MRTYARTRFELEAVAQDADLEAASLVGSDQDAARRRQTVIGLALHGETLCG